MGAVVVSLDTDPTNTVGQQRKMTGTLHLSASYATNGDTFTPGQFGLVQLDDLWIQPAGGAIFQPDLANNKIKALWTGAGLSGVLAEVTNTTDLSAAVARFNAYGV